MTRRDWEQEDGHALGVFLNGREIEERTPHGEPIADDSFLLLLNAHGEPVTFRLPTARFGARWALELSTVDPDAGEAFYPTRAEVPVESRSLVLLRRAR
jgi:glycogen operon protein